MEILTLLKASIKYNKFSFFSVFILMLIVSMTLTGAISVRQNTINTISEANDAIGSGDVVAIIRTENCSKDMLSKLEESKYVDHIQPIESFLSIGTTIQGIKDESRIYYTAYDEEKGYHLFREDLKGYVSSPRPLQKGEVYLPLSVKYMYSCEVGDTLQLQTSEHNYTFTITGFIEEPFTGSDIINMKTFFITKDDFQTLYEESIKEEQIRRDGGTAMISPFLWIHIDTAQTFPGNIEAFCRSINEETGIMDQSEDYLTREQSEKYTRNVTEILCGVLYVFLTLLLIIIILVLSVHIGNSIELAYVNLGILKANGFTEKHLRTVLLFQFLLPVLLGEMTGLILSTVAISYLRQIFIKASYLYVSGSIQLRQSLLILTMILVFLGILIYVKTSRIGKISPVRAIAGGMKEVHFSNLFTIPVLGRSKAWIGIRIAVRQMTSNMRQYGVTCLILAGFVFYFSSAFGFKDNFTHDFLNEMYGFITADLCIDYHGNYDMRPEVEQAINANSAIIDSFSYGDHTFFMDDVLYHVQILDDTGYLKSIVRGNQIHYDNEVLLSGILSKKIGKSIGDTVMLQYGDIAKEYIVCGIYDSVHYAGDTFALTFEGAQNLCPDILPEKRYYLLKDTSKVGELQKMIDDTYGKYHIQTTKVTMQSEYTLKIDLMACDAINYFLFFMGAVFIVIVLWMSCFRSFQKERTDIGIYKACGFSSLRIRLQFCFRYLLIGLVADILGMFTYILLGDRLNATSLKASGITSFDAPLTMTSLLITPLIILILIVTIAFLVTKRIYQISTRELIVQ